MNNGIQIGLGVIAAIAAVQLWRHGDRISKSRYWVVGWAAYMLLIAFAGRALAPLLNGLPAVDDDVAVPCLLFGMVLVVGLLACVQLHRMRKLRKG